MSSGKSIVVPANTGTFECRTPTGWARFTPNGPMRAYHAATYHANASAWDSGPLWSARLFVGLSVGSKNKYTLRQVADAVEEIRAAQVGAPDSSFLLQHGIYTADDGQVVREKSVQIVILNLPSFNTSDAKFRQQALRLAEELRERFEQESVIVELQEAGISKATFGIKAKGEDIRKALKRRGL